MPPKFTLPLAMLSLLLANCGRKPMESTREIEGTEDQRIEAVQKILLKNLIVLPTGIADPHFLEEQMGDGRLGPSDFTTFCSFRVPQEQLEKWTALLGEFYKDPPLFVTPKGANAWWVSPEKFAGLKFYDSRKLTGRDNGWVGVDERSGSIFVYSFTM